jgi:single-strand DNA-binding protein
MASLNKVMLIGNLTRDPEVKYTPKGTAVCEIGLAVNRVYTPEGGERQEEVTFIDVTLWGRQAELAQQYLAKGRSVYIEGRLQLDSWEDKQSGQRRSKIRVVAEGMQFLGSRGDGGGRGGDEGGGGAPPQRAPQRQNYGGGGGGNSGGGYGGGGSGASSRPPQRAPQAADDDFGDGPIHDGLEGDDIPF